MINTLLEFWISGGWVMVALACLALVTFTTAFHLLFALYYRGISSITESEMLQWMRQPERIPKRFRALVQYVHGNQSKEVCVGRFKEIEFGFVSNVDRQLASLKVMVISAPLFGLLGTVLGMYLTFTAIGVGGGSSEVIAKGISEALVATQSGMMVAIPGLFFCYLIKIFRNEYVNFLAQLQTVTFHHFDELKTTSNPPSELTITII